MGPALGGGIKLKVQGNSHRSWRVWLEDAPCVLAHKRCWAHYESLRLFGWPFRGHSSLRSPRLAVPRPTRSALEDRPLPRREKTKSYRIFCCGTCNCHKPLNARPKPSPRQPQTSPQVVRREITYFPAFCSFFYFFFLLKIPLKIAVFGWTWRT